MERYLLDTSAYGVLVDEQEEDYEVVKNIIEYARENRDKFVTTFIIAQELGSKKVDKRIRDITLPVYYLSISINKSVLEIVHSNKYELAQKLAWNYIQRLEKKDIDKTMPDALNYAWLASLE